MCASSSEIAGRLGVQATALARPLARLIEIGLVKREVPFGESEKNSKKSLYRLSDPFCRFWFSVMATRRSIFDSAPETVRLAIWRQHAQHVFAVAWEDLSRAFVASSERLRSLVGEDGYWLPAGRWWHKMDAEWDVVSVDGEGSQALLGEAKWSERPFTQKEVEGMAERIVRRNPPTGMPEKHRFVLFLASVEDKSMTVCNGVEIVTAEDVVGR